MGGGVGGGWGQGGCERRSGEAFVKIPFFGGGEGLVGGGRVWSGGWGRVWSGGGGCEQRSEAFVKIKKKKLVFWGGQEEGGPVGGGSGWM